MINTFLGFLFGAALVLSIRYIKGAIDKHFNNNSK